MVPGRERPLHLQLIRDYPKIRNNPTALNKLYSYRAPILASLTKNLMALGLDKVPPPTKSLEELLAEPEQEEPINDGQSGEEKP